MPSAADLEAAEQAELAAQYADSLRAAEPATGGDDPDDGRPSKSGRRHKSRAWVEKLHAEARACLEEEPPSAEQALVLLQKAVFLSPQDGVTYALRAEAYVYACDFCSAVLNLKRSVACAGGVGRAAGGGDGGGSRTYQLVKARKRLSEVVDAQALALLQAGVVEEAEELFALACEAERMSPAPLLHRALAQFMLGRYSEALRSLSTAAALAPTDARVFLLRAKVHWETKNFGHAALAATEGLKVGRLPELVALAAGLRQQVWPAAPALPAVGVWEGGGARTWRRRVSCVRVWLAVRR
jgi:Flp pilus assembly protein TadD